MLCPTAFLVPLMLICGGIIGIRAQLCIPNSIDELDLSADGLLTWIASDNCPNTMYMIRISLGGAIQYEYSVTETSLDVSFLIYCRNYNFTVYPVSTTIVGMESTLQSSLALPDGTDIRVSNLTANQIDNDLLFTWIIDDRYKPCLSHTHMLVWDDDSESPEEWFFFGTTNGYYFENIAQCMHYRFDVTAYYYNTNGTTSTFNYMVPATTNTPTLEFVRQDALTINTTWALEKYSRNRCNVTALHITSPRFNATVPINDTPLRPTVDVSIAGLRADSMYYFNVTVENEGGISNGFQMAVQTLPIDPTAGADSENEENIVVY